MANKIVCKSCASEFDDMLPQCPYCGSINDKGADREENKKAMEAMENSIELMLQTYFDFTFLQNVSGGWRR